MSSPSKAKFYLKGVVVKELNCNAGWFGFSGDWFNLIDKMCKHYYDDDHEDHPMNFEWDEVEAYFEKINRCNIKRK